MSFSFNFNVMNDIGGEKYESCHNLKNCSNSDMNYDFNKIAYLNSNQIDYILQIKAFEYNKLICGLRHMCDDKIKRDVAKGKMPVKFKIPSQMLKKGFDVMSIKTDLIGLLEKNGFYVQTMNDDENFSNDLLIYPKGMINCSFMKLNGKTRGFVQKIKSIENDKMQKEKQNKKFLISDKTTTSKY